MKKNTIQIIKVISFIALLTTFNQCFSVNFITDNEFINLCETIDYTEEQQKQASLILRSKLNSTNQLNILNWLSNQTYYNFQPINYAFSKKNFFIAKELIDYITFDPNKLQPFSYTNGSISNDKSIASKNYNNHFLTFYLPDICYIGNKKLVELICNFYSDLISVDIILKSIKAASLSEKFEIINFLTDFLAKNHFQNNILSVN